jgi:MoxR-like ATPase
MNQEGEFSRPEFQPSTDRVLELEPMDSWPRTRHRFDDRSILAVRTAIAAERPLLVRGKPGIGKSQLARAGAQHLNLPVLYHVVNSRTEHSDLLYAYDAVSRLAQAQVLGPSDVGSAWRGELAEDRFVCPGVLWWAFDWAGARKQAKRSCRAEGCEDTPDQPCCHSCGEPSHPSEGDAPGQWRPGAGCVVLIDEIDKADTDMPNGLLESFGNNGFQVPHAHTYVRKPQDHLAPVVIITTNEERELPAAFLRRCVVLHMKTPKDETQLREFLMRRGRDHCGKRIDDEDVYRDAADQLLEDRHAAMESHSPMLPGPAEYLDLLYAIGRMYPRDSARQKEELARLREFVYRKESMERDV